MRQHTHDNTSVTKTMLLVTHGASKKTNAVLGHGCCVAGTTNQDPLEGKAPIGGPSLAPRDQQRSSTKPVTAPVSGWLIRQRGILPCLFSNTTCLVHSSLNTKPLESGGVSQGYQQSIVQHRAITRQASSHRTSCSLRACCQQA